MKIPARLTSRKLLVSVAVIVLIMWATRGDASEMQQIIGYIGQVLTAAGYTASEAAVDKERAKRDG